MKVIYTNNRVQNSSTINPQVIDGQIHYWCIQCEMLKVKETFREWLIRTIERTTLVQPDKNTIIIYDVELIEISLMVHYALLTT